MTPNTSVRYLLSQMIFNARLISNQAQLQQLLDDTVPQLVQTITDENLILSEQQVIERYPFFTLNALRNMRCRRIGPPFHKLGRHKNSRVTYRVGDIETWLAKHANLKN